MKKTIKNISFSNVAFQPVKIRHVSDQSIARCNKNIEPVIKENRKVFQKIFQHDDGSRSDILY